MAEAINTKRVLNHHKRIILFLLHTFTHTKRPKTTKNKSKIKKKKLQQSGIEPATSGSWVRAPTYWPNGPTWCGSRIYYQYRTGPARPSFRRFVFNVLLRQNKMHSFIYKNKVYTIYTWNYHCYCVIFCTFHVMGKGKLIPRSRSRPSDLSLIYRSRQVHKKQFSFSTSRSIVSKGFNQRKHKFLLNV